jgi:hypothetical protein
MSNTENKKPDEELSATENPRDVAADNPLADTSSLISHEIPPGVDRRNFLIRSAVGGAAAVMVGRAVSIEARTAMAVATLPQEAKGSKAKGSPGKGTSPPPPLDKDLDVVKKGQGPVLTTVDEFYKVGPGPSSSHTIGPHYLRFLSASHQTAGRQTGQGDGAEGQPVRKPERHGKGTWHGTRCTGGTGRQRARNRRPEISRQPARQA